MDRQNLITAINNKWTYCDVDPRTCDKKKIREMVEEDFEIDFLNTPEWSNFTKLDNIW